MLWHIVSAVQVRCEGRLTSLVSLVRSWLSMIGKCVTVVNDQHGNSYITGNWELTGRGRPVYEGGRSK